MSKLVMCCFVFLGLLQAPNLLNANLNLCNKTPIELWSALGYLDNGKWVSKGWWKTEPGECVRPIVGALDSRYYYHFTQNKRFNRVWQGDSTFCVHPTNPFGPTTSEKCPSGFSKASFAKIDTGQHTAFNFNLSCRNCGNPHFQLARDRLLVNYLHTENIEGQNVSFLTGGEFSASGNSNRLRLNYSLEVGLKGLQSTLTAMLRPKVNKSDDCGDVIRLQNVALKPHSAGKARVDVNIHFERWHCVKAHVPEIRGLKVEMKLRTLSKTRLLESGISGTLELTPTVHNGNRVKLSGNVTNVRVRNDLARFLTRVLDVDLRALAQSELQKSLGNGGAIEGAIPPELRPFFELDNVRFHDRGQGTLSLKAAGSATVTSNQISALCRRHAGFC